MAVRKAIRSNPPAQPQPQPKSERPNPNHQLKANLFEALRHINRGYGIALGAFDRLEIKDRQHAPRAFPPVFCMTTATARKLSALSPTATFFASSPDAKTTKPSVLALA